MQCPSCAASYEDTFKFCPYCGRSKPEPATVHVKIEEPKWQYLEIAERREVITGALWGFLDFGPDRKKLWFEAYVGSSLVAKGCPFEVVGGRIAGGVSAYREAKQTLVDELEAQGWEPIVNDDGEINAVRRRKSLP